MDETCLISGGLATAISYITPNIVSYFDEKNYFIQKQVEYKDKEKVLNEPRIVEDTHGHKFRTTVNPNEVTFYYGLEKLLCSVGRSLARKRFEEGKFDKVIQNMSMTKHLINQPIDP